MENISRQVTGLCKKKLFLIRLLVSVTGNYISYLNTRSNVLLNCSRTFAEVCKGEHFLYVSNILKC